MPTLTNLTRANEIGANSYLIEGSRHAVILDSGLHPKIDGRGALPQLDAVRGRTIDAMFLSHAHLDHVGSLPMMTRACGEPPVFMTGATANLADPVLRNCVNVMKKKAEQTRIPDYPLFGHKEVDACAALWRASRLAVHYDLHGNKLGAGDQGDSFALHYAGHILGSAAVELRMDGMRILYTGDINLRGQDLCLAADLPEQGIDVLITEATRGAAPTPPGFSRENELERLAEGIRRTFDRGGAVLIPVFALGKTQETLAAIERFQAAGRLPAGPVHIGGLSWKFSMLYDAEANQFPRQRPHFRLIDGMAPKLMDGRSVRGFVPKRGHIYLLSSGMMNKFTLSHLIAEFFLANPQHSLFFVGYTDPDSVAGQIRVAAREGRPIALDALSRPIPIECEVDHFDLSAHAERTDLIDLVERLKPRTVVLVHADAPALEWMQREIAARCPGTRVLVPRPGHAETL